VGRQQEPEAQKLETADAERQGAEPAQDEEDRRQGEAGEHAAPEDERLAGQVYPRDDHRDEAPARRDPRHREVPRIWAHARGC
jgi:hypothetical protein